jgi:hypothetical protein
MHNRHRVWGHDCDRLLIYRRYPAAEAGLAELDEFLLGSPSLAAEARMRERMPPRPDPAADLVRVPAAAYRKRTTATASWQWSVLIIAALSAVAWAAVILIVIAALSIL